jgi:hypothetical protein
MAATYQVDAATGAGPTMAAWPANGRFHRADSHPTTDGSTTFIPIPSSSTNYSWRKSFKLNVTATPTGTVANLRFFSDGSSWGTGITCYAKLKAAYTQGSSSDNSALFDGTAVDVTTYTSGSPLTITAGTVLSNPSTGYGTQDYLVLQVGGTSSAAAGTTAARTLTYRVDET